MQTKGGNHYEGLVDFIISGRHFSEKAGEASYISWTSQKLSENHTRSQILLKNDKIGTMNSQIEKKTFKLHSRIMSSCRHSWCLDLVERNAGTLVLKTAFLYYRLTSLPTILNCVQHFSSSCYLLVLTTIWFQCCLTTTWIWKTIMTVGKHIESSLRAIGNTYLSGYSNCTYGGPHWDFQCCTSARFAL